MLVEEYYLKISSSILNHLYIILIWKMENRYFHQHKFYIFNYLNKVIDLESNSVKYLIYI